MLKTQVFSIVWISSSPPIGQHCTQLISGRLFLSGTALALTCLGLVISAPLPTVLGLAIGHSSPRPRVEHTGRALLVQLPRSMGLYYFMRPANPHYLRSAGHISRRPSVLTTLFWCSLFTQQEITEVAYPRRCLSLHRRNRLAALGGAPVASVLSNQLLPLLLAAGALRLPAAREAAATLPQPGPLLPPSGMRPRGCALLLLRAPGGARLGDLPPGGEPIPGIGLPWRQVHELWCCMTGLGPRHPSRFCDH